MMTRFLVRLATAGALLPIPIGVGPRYHPPPGTHGTCVQAPLEAGSLVHLELFARRRAIVVPAGIGLRGAHYRFGQASSAHCRAPLWTSDPTGVVHVDRSATLGDLFRVWGEPLARSRLLSFRGTVRLYRNGVLRHGDPRRFVLRAHDELVLEVGAFVPPHRSYRFPR
jgi:hypothetical protein